MKFIKKYLPWIIYAGLGTISFILFTVPYLALWYRYGYNEFSSISVGISGYKILGLWDGGFSGVMISLFQLLILIVFLALIGVGVMGLLNRFGVTKLKEKYGKITFDQIGGLLLIIYTALNVLLFIFLIVFVASNGESGVGGYSLNAGIFITLFHGAGALGFRIFLHKKYPSEEQLFLPEPKVQEKK
jgi:hypothetical protein